MLNEKAQQAALTWALEAASDGGVPGHEYVEGILTAYLAALPSSPVSELVERLNEYVAYFEAVETKPSPVELYYAIKNEGENSGWGYRATGFGPSDIREAADRLTALERKVSEYETGLVDFHQQLTSLEAENAQLREGLGGRESAKLYHSLWPTEDLLKARGPGGLITDDGEAWKYQYTHSDAQGGTYDLVYRPTSEHSAITAPQGGDHGE